MKSVYIKLNEINDVYALVNTLVSYDGEVDLESGRYKVDGKSLLCTSSGCHDGLTATLRTDKNAKPTLNPFYFYNAFHGPYPSCVACHTESLAAGKPAGPTDCKACHQAPSP